MVRERGDRYRQKSGKHAPDEQQPDFHDVTSATPIIYF
jgi:hypothetical protein